jgi:PAS domain S-box-containing protein
MSAESIQGDAPVNVLLVDDRPDKLLALESILANQEHNVITARSGAEALRRLLQNDFAVILLDVNMPLMDGFQTASLIRGRPRSENTPIIFLTAVNDGGLAQGYSLGAVDYIRMPVEPEVLRTKVRVFAELFRKREQIRSQAEARRLSLEREHAARLAEANEQLERETSRNRFFTLAPELLGIAGLDGLLRQVNGSWERALGVSPEVLCRRPIVSFLHPDDVEAAEGCLRQLSRGAPTARFDARFRHRDGSHRWLAWSIAAFSEEGLLYAFVQDITFRKQAEEERIKLACEQEARQAAERENEIKDQFLATLSHELRAPLTPILGWASVLRTGQLDAAATTHALDVIERNVRLQAQLVEDLLDVSRIVSGKLRMEPAPLDLRGVVEAGLEAVRPAAEAKGVRIQPAQCAQTLPVIGDAHRLQQIVWNLASNAVKFSPEGGRVEVELDRTSDQARLRVRDEGVGISAEFLPHVFDRFSQAASGTSRAHGGLGLGLTIVKHLVEAHEGSVKAESDGVGTGACFTVLLPLATDRVAREHGPAEASAEVARASEESLPGVSILVVDDEEDVREMLGVALRREGAHVALADSMDAALAAFDAERPHVVLTDIGMPVCDGFALMEALRTRMAESGEVPVVALTAFASPDDETHCRAAGFQLHLAKPIEPARVVEAIARLVPRSEQD